MNSLGLRFIKINSEYIANHRDPSSTFQAMARTKNRGRRLPKGFQIPKEELDKMTPEERKAFIIEAKKSHGKKIHEQKTAAAASKNEAEPASEKAPEKEVPVTETTEKEVPVTEINEESPEA